MLVSAPASAEATIVLVVESDPGASACRDAAVIRREVCARLGYDPFRAAAPRTATLGFGIREGRLEAHLTLTRDGVAVGTRTLSSDVDDCAALREDVILALVMAIDPLYVAPTPEVDTEPPAVPLPTPEVVSVPARPRTRVSPAREPDAVRAPDVRPHGGSGIELSLGALGQLGTAPLPTLGLRLAVGWTYDWIAIHAGVRGTIPVDLAMPGDAPMGARVATFLTVGDFALCGRVLQIEVCATGSLGALLASAEQLPNAVTASALYASVGARVGYSLLFGAGIGLRPTLELQAQLNPVAIAVGSDTLFGLGPVSGAIGVELFWRSSE